MSEHEFELYKLIELLFKLWLLWWNFVALVNSSVDTYIFRLSIEYRGSIAVEIGNADFELQTAHLLSYALEISYVGSPNLGNKTYNRIFLIYCRHVFFEKNNKFLFTSVLLLSISPVIIVFNTWINSSFEYWIVDIGTVTWDFRLLFYCPLEWLFWKRQETAALL